MTRWTTSFLLAAALAALPAAAQTVTVNVTDVNSANGRVMATLCGDPDAPFPGTCNPAAMADAREGTTTLIFENVPAGTYALQVFHDENSDMIPNIPPEGYAFGNDAGFPPSFKAASFTVAGDTTHQVKMTYLTQFGATAPARPAEKGAAAPAGVVKTVVRDDGLLGAFYIPEGTQRRPALLVLGGSEGGLAASSGVGLSFTNEGYAVLALAYFMEDGLPQSLENIPLEYFDKAVAWLKRQPGVDPDAIGVIGGSRGSEAALLLASRDPSVKAVMAFAPSGVVWQGLNFANPMNMGPAWTVDGKPLPFLTPDGRKYRPGTAMKPMFDATLASEARTEVDIPVERIKAPILLISGKDDALWPSWEMGEAIVKRLAAANFAYDVQHLGHEGTGHLVFMGNPDSAGAQSMAKAPPNPMLGGTAEAGLAAWKQNWPVTLAFFNKALKD